MNDRVRKLKLDAPIPRELMTDVEEKLTFATEELEGFRLDPSRPTELELTLKEGARWSFVKDKVTRLVKGMITGWRTVPVEVLFDRREKSPTFSAPIWPKLIENGWVQTLAPGQVAIQGLPLRLLEYFDRNFITLARQLGATAVRYPQMIAIDALEKCQYFSSFPHHVTFCSHLREDLDVITEFATAQERNAGHSFDTGLHRPSYIANPAVCFHAYHSLSGRALSGPRTLTTVGRCFRYEGSAMTSLERLWDFTMREIIFIGLKEDVLARRTQTIEALSQLMEVWDLHAWIETANDPFFVTNYVAKKYHQLITNGKYELRLTLPWSGASVAAASFNYHDGFFGQSYDVSVSGKTMHTGCTAFGLERWVFAFLAQHGVDIRNWPESVRTGIAE